MSLFRLQPHCGESFELSTGLFFIEKVRDIVGLYWNPSDQALVPYVDEYSQCQAPGTCSSWRSQSL